MSGLADFLLTRIAEDEERAQFVARQIEGNNWKLFEQWKLSWRDEYDLLCIEPSRALTECEVKRQIVEDNDVCTWGCGEEPNCHNCITLGRLATVYADHPDYREEWRP